MSAAIISQKNLVYLGFGAAAAWLLYKTISASFGAAGDALSVVSKGAAKAKDAAIQPLAEAAGYLAAGIHSNAETYRDNYIVPAHVENCACGGQIVWPQGSEPSRQEVEEMRKNVCKTGCVPEEDPGFFESIADDWAEAFNL